ncbi:hypothetical protein [Streptomyces sp. H27-H5]|uniref:hypothetical protein n=1 Tax=Streptomyces sp. H27-H5 TaxID=2996460 RepID=UPI00226F2C02|nr:hypothetical protein [Streptomyces sp. H27-H5]MCY0962900.1 hypothetical protein [Streptomyces sp. H27-H5]
MLTPAGERAAVQHLDVTATTRQMLLAPAEGPCPPRRDLPHPAVESSAGAFTGLGMPDDRAQCEATLLVDTLLGLLHAPLADGTWDRATATFQTLLDRLEPALHTCD